MPEGERRNSSPTRSSPLNTVPVTTVPVPGSKKLRSTVKRKRPVAGRVGMIRAASRSRASSDATPCPVPIETGTIAPFYAEQIGDLEMLPRLRHGPNCGICGTSTGTDRI